MQDIMIYHTNCPKNITGVAPAFRDTSRPMVPEVARNLDHQFRCFVCDLCGLNVTLHFTTEDYDRVR